MDGVSSVVPSALIPNLDRSDAAPTGSLAVSVSCAPAISMAARDPLTAPKYFLRVIVFGLPKIKPAWPETDLRPRQSDAWQLRTQAAAPSSWFDCRSLRRS